ncbi:unnamed protein product [Somion occarium]|uniref:Phytochrome n=1 Tax=Somion occarium TaxID=3059160 RepID=A0ABP1E2P1_9APHY
MSQGDVATSDGEHLKAMPQAYVFPARSLLSGIQKCTSESTSGRCGDEPSTASDTAHRISPSISSKPLTEAGPSSQQVASSSGSHSSSGLLTGPAGEPLAFDPGQIFEDMDTFDARHPAQLSEVAAEAFANAAQIVDIPASPAPFISNISQSGIVHLAPVEPRGDSPSSCARSSGSASRGGSGGTSGGSGGGSGCSHQADFDVVQMPSTHASRPHSPVSGHGSHASSTSGTNTTDGPHITFRYQHVEDENGHHLIVGREGTLTKCEDEPIRTPGAVQGFGVLVAIQEEDETGNLVVRQVSENCTELLGLSPRYLFSLPCFSEAFPDSQADLLFDNIQYLSDTALTPEEQAENLHVFMLSGWGEPGSALPEEVNADPQQRRSWTCWCAAHRPQMTAPANLDASGSSTDAALDSNLIILEFELERDPFNPLYPPSGLDDSNYQSGISSPLTDASSTRLSGSGGSASDSSGRTLVSTDSGGIAVTMVSSNEGTAPSPINGGTPSPPARSGTSSVPPGSVTANSNSPEPSSHRSTPPVEHPFSVDQTRVNSEGNETDATGEGDEEWLPSQEAILESTTSRAKPLLALERLRRSRRIIAETPATPASFSSGMGSRTRRTARTRRGGGAVGMMDVFDVMAQINEQLGAAPDLESFLSVVVGVIKDLTQFHRVLAYQFDEAWNGKVMAELVDWDQTHDLFKGLHFPASDIPAQARSLYVLNKVRLLYDRGQATARLLVRSRKDLETPLDMTHCYLRAMSPIHLKYLGNMGVRASMSVSIIAFGSLWGLVACHSYGPHGMRVSFPVRQMLRLLSQSISRNVERLSYAQRLHTRKLVYRNVERMQCLSHADLQINTLSSEQHPTGYIVSNADDLLGLFDADYGVLVIGEGAKILGPNMHSQEILIVAEYLRLKQFDAMQVSQAVTVDYPDLQLSNGLEVIAGLLYVPLSVGGGDFIAFLRKGQPRQVKWAGRPYRQGDFNASLEPRKSFRLWSETVAGRCRAWSDEHLETAGVLALVYGKFIEVWRQKETALQATKLTNILLSNASHEVRTPLNHIINYLELALNGHLDGETRENLSQSHAASKSLLFTINDLLDLTRLESGNETSFNEPFNLRQAIDEATMLYRNEAARRGLGFDLDLSQCPKTVVGDAKKIRTVVANLTANAVKYTTTGGVKVECHAFEEPAGLRDPTNVAVEIVVEDTGCGIPTDKLESIFREFEQVEVSQPAKVQTQGLGLGLAIVARIVEQLGGQLRVDSKLDIGSRFSFLIPFATEDDLGSTTSPSNFSQTSSLPRSRAHSHSTRDDQIDNLVQALSSSHIDIQSARQPSLAIHSPSRETNSPLTDSPAYYSPKRVFVSLVPDAGNEQEVAQKVGKPKITISHKIGPSSNVREDPSSSTQLRILIVEDNDINRTILAKRLTLDGHVVVNTTNGQEGLEMVKSDRDFDCVLMDIQMPLLNGYEATERIRALESESSFSSRRLSQRLNGRLPIFAVSASLFEEHREEMYKLGIDGWILKPIDFKRLRIILKGVTDLTQREKDVYRSGCNWEIGGWLTKPGLPHENYS